MISRIFWTAMNSFMELIRDRAVVGFVFVGVIFIFAGRIMSDLAVVEQKKMILDTGLGATFLIGIMISLFCSTNILDREIRERQVFCTLAKPIPRYAWLIGKTAGMVLTLALTIGILTLFVFLFAKLETGLWIFSLFLGGFFTLLMMLVISGYTIMFSAITSQFMAMFYGLLVLLIGYSVDDLRVYWNSTSGAARALSHALYYIIPDLQSFSAHAVVMGQVQIPLSLVFYLVLYALAYFVIPLTVAMIVLERREFE